MKNNRRTVLLAVLLMISCINYGRIIGIENIRPIEFLSIFAIGALSSLLVKQLVERFKNE
jgi:hypothetical protein